MQSLKLGRVLLDNSGNIGKSYRRHDEIGTPICITVDFQSIEDNTVTIRDRDTMEQERISISDVGNYFQKSPLHRKSDPLGEAGGPSPNGDPQNLRRIVFIG